MPDDSLVLSTIRDLRELENIGAIWKSWPGGRDSDLDFFCSMVRSRGDSCRPHVILLTRNSQPDAMLIGLCERRKLRFRLGSFTICQPEVNVLELVYGGLRGNAHFDNCSIFVREVLRSLKAGVADLALWKQLEIHSPMYDCVLHLPSFALRDHSGWLQEHWWLKNFPKGREAFLRGLGRNQRSKLQRKYKKVLNRFAGTVQILSFHSTADLTPAIADMEAIASKTKKRKIFGDGFFDTGRNRAQMAAAAERGWLRIYILYLEGKPAAFWMGTLYERCLQGDHTGYDPAWSEFSPGIFLFLGILEDLRNEDIKIIDFGYGNTQLRRCFGNLRQVESRAQIYAPSLRGIRLSLLRTATCRTTDCVKTAVRWTHRLKLKKRDLWNQFARQQYRYCSTLPNRFRSAVKIWAG
jgi:Acetyltransferase (GNAT) domain